MYLPRPKNIKVKVYLLAVIFDLRPFFAIALLVHWLFEPFKRPLREWTGPWSTTRIWDCTDKVLPILLGFHKSVASGQKEIDCFNFEILSSNGCGHGLTLHPSYIWQLRLPISESRALLTRCGSGSESGSRSTRIESGYEKGLEKIGIALSESQALLRTHFSWLGFIRSSEDFFQKLVLPQFYQMKCQFHVMSVWYCFVLFCLYGFRLSVALIWLGFDS